MHDIETLGYALDSTSFLQQSKYILQDVCMTRLNDALSHLADIHAQLAKTDVYRGLTARPVMLTGFVGILAACLQPRLIGDGDAIGFVTYWLCTALACVLIGSSTAIYGYLFDHDALGRRRAQVVAGQLIPCLAAGAFLVLALLPVLDRCIGMLPGIWALLYALGLFSVRPFLPHATGWVAFYFLVAGTLLLNFLPLQTVPSPWSVAGVFAIGQFGLAWVLHRNSVRETNLV
jgi:hypothetical protein